jgi:hypothetical protein
MIARQRYEGITTAAALGANCPVVRDERAAPALPAVAPAAGNGKRRW